MIYPSGAAGTDVSVFKVAASTVTPGNYMLIQAPGFENYRTEYMLGDSFNTEDGRVAVLALHPANPYMVRANLIRQVSAGTGIAIASDGTISATGGSAGSFSPANQLQYNLTGFTPTNSTGNTYWDADAGTLATVLDSTSGVVLQHGQELMVACTNKTGATIPDTTVVYINGAQGNHPTCAKAQANALSTCQVIGITTQAIADNATGFVTIAGHVHGFDTSVFGSDGQTLYLSASTPGALTVTAPSSPNYVVAVGTNLNTTNNGVVFVAPHRPIAADITLSGNSNTVSPTQAAVKAYADTKLGATATAADSDKLDGQHGAYYADIPGRLGYTPVNKAGDTGVGNISMGALTATSALISAYNTSGSQVRVGGLEVQSSASNNHWIADNLYYSGAWLYRGNGYGSQIYLDSGNRGIVFLTAPFNSGGADAVAAPVTALTINRDGGSTFAGSVSMGALTSSGAFGVGSTSTFENTSANSYSFINIKGQGTGGGQVNLSSGTISRGGMYADSTGLSFYTGAGTVQLGISSAGGASFGSYAVSMGALTATSGAFSLGVNMATTSGNVGIGTTAPGAKLTLSQDADIAVRFDTTSASVTARNWAIVNSHTAYGDFGIMRSTALGGNPLTDGTAALYFSAYNGSATFPGTVNTGGDFLQTGNSVVTNVNYELYLQTDSAKDIIFRPNSVEKMRIATTGETKITGGGSMTGGWNRNLVLSANYPGIVFNSYNTNWASINYDYSSDFVIRVGATTSNTFADGVYALRFNAISGAATFASSVSMGALTASGNSSFTSGRFNVTDGTNTMTFGQWDGENNRIESASRPLLLVTYTGGVSIGTAGSPRFTVNADGSATFNGYAVSMGALTATSVNNTGRYYLNGYNFASNIGTNSYIWAGTSNLYVVDQTGNTVFLGIDGSTGAATFSNSVKAANLQTGSGGAVWLGNASNNTSVGLWNNGGSGVSNLYVDSTATFTSSVSMGALTATSGAFAGNGVDYVHLATAGNAGIQVVGTAGASRSLMLVGQGGYSNGFTVNFNGSNMVYAMNDGPLTVSGALTATMLRSAQNSSAGQISIYTNAGQNVIESLDIARTGYNKITSYSAGWDFHNGGIVSASISGAGSLTATRTATVTGSATNWNTASALDLTDTVAHPNSRAWRISNVGSPDYGYLNFVVAVNNSTSIDTSRITVLTLGSSSSSFNGLPVSMGALTATSGAFSLGVNMATSSGNVGIGTTTPQGKLHVHTTNGGADGIGGAVLLSRYYDGGTSYRAGAIFEYYGSTADQDMLAFAVTQDTTPVDLAKVKMVIGQNGNVGIGTTSPGSKLTINTGTNYNAGFRPSTEIGLSGGTALQFHNDSRSAFAFGSIDGSTLVLNASSGGNVGIGNNGPNYKLDTTGTINSGTGTFSFSASGTPTLNSSQRYLYRSSNDIMWQYSDSQSAALLHIGNVGTNAATLQAAVASATAPLVGTIAQRTAYTPAVGTTPYWYATDETASDGLLGTLRQWTGSAWGAAATPQSVVGRVVAGVISAGAVGAQALAASITTTGVLKSTGATLGTSTAAPVGFTLTGTPYTSTCLNAADGSSVTLANTVAELGGEINFGGYPLSTLAIAKMVNGGIKEYTTAGTYSWKCPVGITKVEVTLQGGGASGQRNASGGGGGGAGNLIRQLVSVTPGTTYSIVVGAGGAATTTNTGNAGASSTGFGVTAAGGAASFGINGGGPGANQSIFPGVMIMLRASGAGGGGANTNGYSCGDFAGGFAGGAAGGGGASAMAIGGTGSTGGTAESGTLGSGGGGTVSGTSGAGGAGYALLRW